MRIGSLCSGAGGLDLAVEHVFNGRVVWQCENEHYANRILAARWPDSRNLGDLTRVDWSAVEPVDVICAGWPCQPFSEAGRMRGFDDDRAVWPHVARAIRVLRPAHVVLENVPRVLTAGEFERVANSLAADGYNFAWRCFRASDVGAPHRRNRLFVVACRFGKKFSVQLTGSWLRANGATERDAILPSPCASDGTGGPSDPVLRKAKNHQLHVVDLGLRPDFWDNYAVAIKKWERVLGRPAPHPTEPNKYDGTRVALTFVEWMMGWPAGWVTAIDMNRLACLRLMGNGVVPQQAAAVIPHLLNCLNRLD